MSPGALRPRAYLASGRLRLGASLPARISDIVAAMDGNICRCGTYARIREAIKRAARANFGAAAGKKGA